MGLIITLCLFAAQLAHAQEDYDFDRSPRGGDFDHIDGKVPRQSPNLITSPTTGVRYYRECLTAFATGRERRSESETRARWESALQYMMTAIDQCQTRYPELEPYFQSIRRQSTHIPVHCRGDEEAIIGRADYLANHIRLTLRDDGSLHSRDIAATIFHEYLHFGNGNNRSDHGSLESIEPGPHCTAQYSDDRIRAIERLCFGGGRNTASMDIMKRMQLCGVERGCMGTWTEEGNNISGFVQLFFYPTVSHDLSRAEAARLCRRIGMEGYCDRKKRALKKGRGRLVISSEIRALTREMRARLRDWFPQEHAGAIPRIALRERPELIQTLRQNPCYAASIEELPGGEIRGRHCDGSRCVSTAAEALAALDQSPAAARSDFYLAMLPRAQIRISCPEGTSDEVRHSFRTAYDELYGWWRGIETSRRTGSDVTRVYERQWLITSLKYFADAPSESLGPDNNFRSHYTLEPSPGLARRHPFMQLENAQTQGDLLRVLGASLAARFMNAVARLHPDSPEFDCAAAGFVPPRR